MTLTPSDLKVIKLAFEEYAAAHVAVVSAMAADQLPEHLVRAEERAADHLLGLLRRSLPLMAATCERALAVDAALVKARSTPPPQFVPAADQRAWRNGFDQAVEIIQSKLRP